MWTLRIVTLLFVLVAGFFWRRGRAWKVLALVFALAALSVLAFTIRQSFGVVTSERAHHGDAGVAVP